MRKSNKCPQINSKEAICPHNNVKKTANFEYASWTCQYNVDLSTEFGLVLPFSAVTSFNQSSSAA